MALITLTTDFGLRDPDLGYLKSHILQAIPQANLVDISHTNTPFEPEEAIYILQNALKNFPKGSIHLVGIDSEIHSRQAPIMVVTGKHFYLGNDNGIIPAALEKTAFKVYKLPFTQPDSFLSIHIAAAQQLAKGIMPEEIAVPFENYKSLKLSKPLIRYNEKDKKAALITPKVIYNDHYGNAVFNLTQKTFEQLREGRKFTIKLGHYQIENLVEYYNDIKDQKMITAAGNMYARFNHFGYLEIFIYQSNRQTGGANTLLGLKKNQIINIIFES